FLSSIDGYVHTVYIGSLRSLVCARNRGFAHWEDKMKPRVFIYDVPIKSHFTLSMPRRSKILSFQEQHGKPMLWALVDPDEGMIDCDFRLAGNGHPIEENENELHYRGTVQLNDGALVLHLFEVIRS